MTSKRAITAASCVWSPIATPSNRPWRRIASQAVASLERGSPESLLHLKNPEFVTTVVGEILIHKILDTIILIILDDMIAKNGGFFAEFIGVTFQECQPALSIFPILVGTPWALELHGSQLREELLW
jgi:hypothetical protein